MGHKHIIKGIIAIIALSLLVLLASYLIGLNTSKAPTIDDNEMMTQQPGENPSVASTSLTKITSSSNASTDMDAYLQSADNAPNPNDFNDSYSDLNQ